MDKMIDFNTLFNLATIVIAFLAMYYVAKNGNNETDDAQHERIREAAYNQGKLENKLDSIANSTKRTESMVDKMNDKLSTTTITANEAIKRADRAQERADEANDRIDDLENRIR